MILCHAIRFCHVHHLANDTNYFTLIDPLKC